MWFEILPPAGIIYVAFCVPGFAMYVIQRLVLGNAYRRDLREPFDRCLYLRDRRLTYNPYKINTLKSLPDEDEEENTKKEKK